MVARPRRIYLDEKRNKYYYLVKGKKRFIRVPQGMSQKQIQKINLVNIIGDVSKARKVKPRKKTRRIRLEKPIMENMKQVQTITPFGSVVSFVRAKDGLPSELKKEISFVNPVETFTLPRPQAPVRVQGIPVRVQGIPVRVQGIPVRPSAPLTPATSVQGVSGSVLTPISTPSFSNLPPVRPSAPLTPATSVQGVSGSVLTPISTPSFSNLPPPPTLPTEQQVIASALRQQLNRADQKFLNQLREFAGRVRREVAEITPRPPRPPRPPLTPVFSENKEDEAGSVQTENIFTPTSLTGNVVSATPTSQSARGNGDDDGLFNNEIENILQKRVRKVVPVIASDEVNDLVDIVDNGDKEFMAVINTNPSTSDGSGNDGYRVGHWRCIYVDNRDDFPSVEFYDPLGDEPEKELIKVLHRIAQKMNPETLFKYKVNRVKLQDDESANCGHFVMKFLEDRHRGVPFSKATMFDDVMESCGDKSGIGEMEIKKFKKYL